MTIFDLLFIVLALTAVGTLIFALIAALRGAGSRALKILTRLVICAAAYIAIVYAATAVPKQVVLRPGEPQCSDDWCLAVDHVDRREQASTATYRITLRIFSRAKRRAQRENIATDVYLVDSNWKRYAAIPQANEIPLNTLLQPGESVTTGRVFELPADAHGIVLVVGRRSPPFCLIIGECGAFHKDTVVRLD